MIFPILLMNLNSEYFLSSNINDIRFVWKGIFFNVDCNIEESNPPLEATDIGTSDIKLFLTLSSIKNFNNSFFPPKSLGICTESYSFSKLKNLFEIFFPLKVTSRF